MKRPSSTPSWIIPLLIAFLVGVVGWWTNISVRDAIQNSIKQELHTILTADVTALEIWINDQRQIAESLAQDPTIRSLILELADRSEQTGLGTESLAKWTRRKELESHLHDRLRLLKVGYVIIGRDGRILNSENREVIGHRIPIPHAVKLRRLFASGDPVVLTPFKPQRPSARRFGSTGAAARSSLKHSRISARRRREARAAEPGAASKPEQTNVSFLQICASVKDKLGEVKAALGLVIQPEKEFTRILSVARSGETGETYAFDHNGLLISQSRFDSQLKGIGLLATEPNTTSTFNLELRDPGGNMPNGFRAEKPRTTWPLTRMVANAVKGGFGVDVDPFRDYRGVPVVGAWQWLPKHEFGVATKVDAAEAYQPLEVIRWTFLTLFLMLVLCALAMSLFSYLNQELRERVKEVTLEAKKLGQYTLEKKIGQGGMGTVYKARHAFLRRDTAVKLLLPKEADSESVARFEREVQLTCQLTHPNTIQIYDYGHTPEGIFYYAMEYLHGITLKALVQEHGAQDQGRVIHILTQICASLEEAHRSHLIHRDIKPANVFLCERGGVLDTVKVLDFGLIRNFQDPKAPPMGGNGHSVTGSPHFMAPETINHSEAIDHRSDLYSVGAVGYYLLTGSFVFDGASARDICEMHTSKQPVPPTQLTGMKFCPILEDVLLRCLQKDPTRRPRSAEELAELLEKSPYAHTWTPEKVHRWWEDRRDHKRTTDAAKKLTSTIKLQPTLKIDVERYG